MPGRLLPVVVVSVWPGSQSCHGVSSDCPELVKNPRNRGGILVYLMFGRGMVWVVWESGVQASGMGVSDGCGYCGFASCV